MTCELPYGNPTEGGVRTAQKMGRDTGPFWLPPWNERCCFFPEGKKISCGFRREDAGGFFPGPYCPRVPVRRGGNPSPVPATPLPTGPAWKQGYSWRR